MNVIIPDYLKLNHLSLLSIVENIINMKNMQHACLYQNVTRKVTNLEVYYSYKSIKYGKMYYIQYKNFNSIIFDESK